MVLFRHLVHCLCAGLNPEAASSAPLTGQDLLRRGEGGGGGNAVVTCRETSLVGASSR